MFKLFEHVRKKNSAKKTSPAGAFTLSGFFSGKRRGEIKGIFWWAFALLLVAALLPQSTGRNALGPTGEIVFRSGFALMGVLVYLLPLLAAVYGFIQFKSLNVDRSAYKLLGLGLFGMTAAVLVEMIYPHPLRFELVRAFYSWKAAPKFWESMPDMLRLWGNIALPAGGIPAKIVARFLVAIFSVVGTYIVCGTTFILSLYFLEAEPYVVAWIRKLIERLKQKQEAVRKAKGAFTYAPAPAPKLKTLAEITPAERPKIKISTPPPIPANHAIDALPAAKGQFAKPGPASEAADAGTPLPEEKQYTLPTLELLADPIAGSRISNSYFEEMSHTLENALAQFGVSAKVVEVCPGPVVTRYELQPSPGVKVSRIVTLADDIALVMKAEHVRIEAPIPGKGAVGVEIPNQNKQIVVLKQLVADPEFQTAESVLTFAVGKDIGGKHVFAQLESMPHLLIAGSTGSGKSACINAIISSLLFRSTPREVKFLMIDPKRVELTMYNGIPHLKAPVITDSREASVALKFMVREMDERYRLFAEAGVRDIKSYNQRILEAPTPDRRHMPYILIFIDELADLMMIAANEVENAIMRLAQMARGVGIHMILATQRPSVDVITGVIKANFPSRIAFQVSSKVDSRTILDANGADALLGRGDMLYAPASAAKPLRIQGVFITTAEVERIAKFWKAQGEPVFDMAFSKEKLKATATAPEEGGEDDELYNQAVSWIVRAKQASTSMLQRRLKVGYARAARLLDLMEERGIVGPPEGSKPRKVLIKPEEAGLEIANETGEEQP